MQRVCNGFPETRPQPTTVGDTVKQPTPFYRARLQSASILLSLRGCCEIRRRLPGKRLDGLQRFRSTNHSFRDALTRVDSPLLRTMPRRPKVGQKRPQFARGPMRHQRHRPSLTNALRSEGVARVEAKVTLERSRSGSTVTIDSKSHQKFRGIRSCDSSKSTPFQSTWPYALVAIAQTLSRDSTCRQNA